MKPRPPQINATWLISYLLGEGVPADVIEAGANLSEISQLATLKKLPLLQYLKLLNVAAGYLGDNNLGLNLAESFKADDFGCVGLAVNHSTTMRDALRTAHQFQSLFSQGIDMVFEEGPATSSFTYRYLLPVDEDVRHDVEHSLALLTQQFRALLGESWQPLRVDFIHSQPADIGRHIEVFGKDVCIFNQPNNRIAFSSEYLETRLKDADPQLQHHFRSQLQAMLDSARREEGLLAGVRYYTVLFHNSPQFGADLVADLMHMSRRSLARHLQGLGTSFRKMKEDVVLELAKTALQKSLADINTVALDLGFSDSTAFSRSFKKSTGLTPTQYRDQVLSTSEA
jgi:AraC-like DNA-binding protein